jgi:hypothetical protein
MPRTGALLEEHEALLAAGAIAAQATSPDGFRQRDVRFFLDLFSNWLQATTGTWTLGVHNAQVARSLEVHVDAGWARRVGRKPPRYRLTPAGLVELLQRLVHRKNLARLDEFFLVYHVLDAYGERLRTLVEQSGVLASRGLAVDVDELLDTRRLVARERARVARETERLARRADESRRSSQLVRKLLAQGHPLSAVIERVEREFPYELNSQKPLGELLAALPAPWRHIELEQAAERRAHGLWQPMGDLLAAYDAILADLVRVAPRG